MQTVLLVIHLLIAVGLVGVVLIQKSEGGGLGIGGGTMGGFMTARGSANLLTRTTSILAACFFTTSLLLAWLAGSHRQSPSIFDQPQPVQELPTGAPAVPPSTLPPAAPPSGTVPPLAPSPKAEPAKPPTVPSGQ